MTCPTWSSCGTPSRARRWLKAVAARHWWAARPAGDPGPRPPDLDEANRLTGRRDLRAADIARSWSGEELAEIQHNVTETLIRTRLRAAQEAVDTGWRQTAFG